MINKSQTWENIESWNCVLPPSRPALHHLEYIKGWLASLPKEYPVGVLGSTPEFIDLLIDLGFKNITVFEKSSIAYKRMAILRVHPPIEKVIWGDWTKTLVSQNEQFAALLSDLTSGNIPYDLRSVFYDGVRAALALDGMFIDRVLTGLREPHEFRQHIDSFMYEPINLITANRFNCEILFSSTLLAQNEIVDTTAFYNTITTHFPAPRIEKLIQLVEKVTPRGCIWWYGKLWDDLKNNYFKGFNLIDTVQEPTTSCYHGAAQLFFQKRQ